MYIFLKVEFRFCHAPTSVDIGPPSDVVLNLTVKGLNDSTRKEEKERDRHFSFFSFFFFIVVEENKERRGLFKDEKRV